jgi:ferredoxin
LNFIFSMRQSSPFFTARVEPQGDSVDAWPEHTLLTSLEMGGLNWPSSCRSGTCRTCICQMRQGQVRYDMEWPGLTPEEKAEGWILPCVAYPSEDVILKDPFT